VSRLCPLRGLHMLKLRYPFFFLACFVCPAIAYAGEMSRNMAWMLGSYDRSEWTATLVVEGCGGMQTCLAGIPGDVFSVPPEIVFKDLLNPATSVAVELNYPEGRMLTRVQLASRFIEPVPPQSAHKRHERFAARRMQFVTTAAGIAVDIARLFEGTREDACPLWRSSTGRRRTSASPMCARKKKRCRARCLPR